MTGDIIGDVHYIESRLLRVHFLQKGVSYPFCAAASGSEVSFWYFFIHHQPWTTWTMMNRFVFSNFEAGEM
jgi:hypothetical protein